MFCGWLEVDLPVHVAWAVELGVGNELVCTASNAGHYATVAAECAFEMKVRSPMLLDALDRDPPLDRPGRAPPRHQRTIRLALQHQIKVWFGNTFVAKDNILKAGSVVGHDYV